MKIISWEKWHNRRITKLRKAENNFSIPCWWQTSWQSQSCSLECLLWRDFFFCVSLRSVAAADYQKRRLDPRGESWEHRRTNLPLTLTKTFKKNARVKCNPAHVKRSCMIIMWVEMRQVKSELVPNEVMLMASQDSNMSDERWSGRFRNFLGVSWGVDFIWGEKETRMRTTLAKTYFWISSVIIIMFLPHFNPCVNIITAQLFKF